MDGQREIIDFLSDGASYERPGTIVERMETHISIIFLVEDLAYKLKRSIWFSYLDYSTPALREQYCRAELALNRRTAPTLYRRVRTITREAGGSLAFDGEGIAVEWVVEMHRFSQDDLFDQLARAGKLTPILMRDLGDAIAAFHGAAETTFYHGGRAGTEETIVGNHLNLVAVSSLLDRGLIDALHAASMTTLAAVGPLLDRRRDGGKVRRCHGDLHLRNVCLVDGHPTPFDCIEFSDALSCIDVLYDLAFLLMDLEHLNLRALASITFNRYLDISGDIGGLLAFPLFLSMRAAVRAHVLVTQGRQNLMASPPDEACSYLTLAVGLLHAHPPRLIAIGGLSGAGKSSLAQALASDFRPAPGARVIRSDVIRKRLFDAAPETRLSPTAYGKETTQRVYHGLCDQASATLAVGYTAVADATFLHEEERDAIAAVARRAGVPFLGLWLEVPPDVLAARIATRRHDASDADRAILERQLESSRSNIDWHRIDGGADITTVLAAARKVIALDML
ncbi:MAG: AAA family ATPase [Acetobacteraceae bacterium]